MSEMVGPRRHEPLHGNTNGLMSYVVTNEPKEISNEDNNIEVGYYLHRKKLGEGGFGKVHLATHLRTGHKVAVKVMDKNKLGSELCRVRIEINSLKALRHENIAQLLQVIETNDKIFLILEYCSGGELFDYLVSKSRLSENESKVIMKDLANVLSFIHKNGFAHRDLKPENILFDAKHRIKLIDFGLAANCRENNISLNFLKTCCGSPAYAAPELLVGPIYSGPKVDIWSAGVLLYALLVGRLPFDDENIGALYRKIQSGVYKMPEFISSEAKDLICRMLKKNPKERITVEEILSHPWLSNTNENFNTFVPFIRQNLDEKVVFECIRFFPQIKVRDLRQNITNGVGYQSATYWLIKMNGSPLQGLNAIKSPLLNIQFKTPRRRSKSCDQTNDNENENCSNFVQNIKDSVERSGGKRCARNRVLSPKQITPNSLNSKIPISLLSPKPLKLKEIVSPNNSPQIPPKKPRIIDEHFVLSPLPTKTTMSSKIESTPKKSLFKRFLETATPAKSQKPRPITTATTTKNITLTKYTEPQILIEKLDQRLTAKGIQCKQKDFSLRCNKIDKFNKLVLSFSLEICKLDDKCVIQRKRLKGDAWNYKKVCEEILKISNE